MTKNKDTEEENAESEDKSNLIKLFFSLFILTCSAIYFYNKLGFNDKPLAIPKITTTIGPLLWREVVNDCANYEGKAFWNLRRMGAVEADAVDLYPMDFDSGYMSAKSSKIFKKAKKISNHFYDSSLITKISVLAKGQTALTTWTTVVDESSNQCRFVLIDIKPSTDQDLIDFGRRELAIQNKQKEIFK